MTPDPTVLHPTLEAIQRCSTPAAVPAPQNWTAPFYPDSTGGTPAPPSTLTDKLTAARQANAKRGIPLLNIDELQRPDWPSSSVPAPQDGPEVHEETLHWQDAASEQPSSEAPQDEPSGEQAVNELPPLDVTDDDWERAKDAVPPSNRDAYAQLACRERQLLAAQQRIAELDDKVANGIPLVAHHALLKAAKDEWDRLAELSRKPVVEGLPPRPPVTGVTNHGFGFSAYCDAAEFNTYADAAEARIAAVEAERDEARKQLSAKPKYGCAWCHFVPEGEPETLWPQVQEHLMLCEKRWHGNDAVTYFRNLVNEQRRCAETAEASLAQQAAHEAIYIARTEKAESELSALRAQLAQKAEGFEEWWDTIWDTTRISMKDMARAAWLASSPAQPTKEGE